ncbi:MAG: hypothetical protein ACOZIN_22505 [Myxococcota bacterium]
MTRPLITFAVSLVTAGGLAMVVYLAGTSIPFLATSPTTDPLFGELNQCLLDALGEPRVGFALSADGGRAASYGGSRICVCAKTESGRAQRVFERAFPSVTSAAFDFSGTLWLATQRQPDAEPELWRLAPAERGPSRVGDFAPVALAGHARGVAALDAQGRLVSLAADGSALGYAALRAAPVGGVQLAVNADGSLLSVVAGTGLFVYRAADLVALLAEGPCDVEYLWWRIEPTRAVVQCGPQGSWALELRVTTGEKDAATQRERTRSALAQKLGAYVQACDLLPCSAPPP